MSAIFDDKAVIAALWDALAPAIRPRHPVSDVPFDPPASPAEQAGLLNAFLFDPEVVFVWSKTMTYAHLAVWRDYVNASKRRFAIVCPSDKGNRAETDRLPDTPFWPADTGFDPLRFLPAAKSCRVLLYSTNDRKNVPFITYLPTYMHVSIGHGDSDKLSSANRFAVAYDNVLVADRNAIERFLAADVPIPLEKFLPIGASVVAGVLFDPEPKPVTRLLYAPTFEGWSEEGNFCSVERIASQLHAFAETGEERLAVRGHHAIGTRLAGTKAALKDLVAAGANLGKDKAKQFNWSDAILCDVSGVLSEYLFTGKPIIIPAASNDTLVRSQVAAAGLDRYCHLWAYDEVPLDGFLASLDDQAMRAARLERRASLYQGANSFDDARALFDRAISYLIESHAFRQARSRRHPAPHPAVPSLPPELEKIAVEVRKGKIVLRLPGEVIQPAD